MRRVAVAKLRHIAIRASDVEATAQFYCDAFEMKKVGGATSAGGRAVYLSDGVVNVAVFELFQSGLANDRAPGLNHIGFVVDDLTNTMNALDALGARCILAPPPDASAGGYEVKYEGPDGVQFDVSTHMWPTELREAPSSMM